jgi:hypothetical protein
MNYCGPAVEPPPNMNLINGWEVTGWINYSANHFIFSFYTPNDNVVDNKKNEIRTLGKSLFSAFS